mmetsp:Transcript_48390/g.104215  ORF Transcript_48390/g.104215 Transcript_48390/m.104215 type:complete len:84 (+) Transcript_48390:372-623(+)
MFRPSFLMIHSMFMVIRIDCPRPYNCSLNIPVRNANTLPFLTLDVLCSAGDGKSCSFLLATCCSLRLMFHASESAAWCGLSKG